MNKTAWIAALAMIALSACAWVKPTDAGLSIRLVGYDQVGQCKKLGKTTVSVLDKVGFISRAQDKVGEELKILARNSAAEMGGDTIVAAGAVSGGEQPFDVFRCDR